MKSFVSETAVSATARTSVFVLSLYSVSFVAAAGRGPPSGDITSTSDRLGALEYGRDDAWNKEPGAGIVVPEERWYGAASQRSKEKPPFSVSQSRTRGSPASLMSKPSGATGLMLLKAAAMSVVTMLVWWRLGNALWKCLGQGGATRNDGSTPRSLFESEQDVNCAELGIPSGKDYRDSWGVYYQPTDSRQNHDFAGLLSAADYNGQKVVWAREQGPGNERHGGEAADGLPPPSGQDEQDDDLPLLPRPDQEASALPPLQQPKQEAGDISVLPRLDESGMPLLSQPAEEPGGLPLPRRHGEEARDADAVLRRDETAAAVPVHHSGKAAGFAPGQQAGETADISQAESHGHGRLFDTRARRRALAAFVVSTLVIATAIFAGCVYASAVIARLDGTEMQRKGFSALTAAVTASCYAACLYMLYRFVRNLPKDERTPPWPRTSTAGTNV